MSLECELKYLDVDLDALRLRLAESGAEGAPARFETNIVFDHPDRSLKKAGVLLRLRDFGGEATLTVKRPPDHETLSTLKIFEEIESGVENFDAVREALRIVGFHEAFSYEKVRECWKFMQCTVCLDRLPFGDFVEIEGSKWSVFRCAEALGLDEQPTSRQTYRELNLEHRRLKDLYPEESFVFTPDEKRALLAEIGGE
ncbi:class IV adenylate cyclase [Pseudodesulfovibrio sp.]|uniref:class IV adenylate cyclase n=1 Tax=Pseudodesulfovibrio sp. TaxID=2035812 RepID=UPI00262C03BF|nr:class IV adenylate cyclase [Pseudodesulfovibrio sp.]MDD3310825.1 class IV adenylate cyclase [Pseudodesulfovibrio sp.]